MTQAGISSRAAGEIKNKEKTFQGQRFDDDLDLSWVQFKYRNHDPQIGRFIEVDPLSDKYVYNSTYAFSENHVTVHVELEGLEKEYIFAQAWRENGISSSSDPVEFAERVGKELLKPSTWLEGYAAAGQIAMPVVLTTIMTGGAGDGAILNAERQTLKLATTSETLAGGEVSTAVNLEARAQSNVTTLWNSELSTTTSSIAKTPSQLGKEGMASAGIEQNTVRIPSATGTANYRIPDGLTQTTLTEVKNVAQQSLTYQIKDFVHYAETNQLKFELNVRTNTTLSKPLQQKVDQGRIVLRRPIGD